MCHWKEHIDYKCEICNQNIIVVHPLINTWINTKHFYFALLVVLHTHQKFHLINNYCGMQELWILTWTMISHTKCYVHGSRAISQSKFPDCSRNFPGLFPDLSRAVSGPFPDLSRTFPWLFPAFYRTFPGHFRSLYFGPQYCSSWLRSKGDY